MKNAAIGLGAVLVIALVAWLVVFGATAQCDAMRAGVDEATQAEPPEVRQAAREATMALGSIQCTAIAARLKAGDRSVLTIAVVRK
ncbi:MAG: hypothetical protein EXR72_17455 [Myxococcales bacterium]|nr:hypothetical protein [Myxococcales bacterium]